MSIFDRIASRFAAPQPTPPQRLGGVNTRELGESGTENYHGFITQDYNNKFHGSKAIAIYDEMRSSDATVNAVLKALKLPILSTPWSIESADVEDQAANDQAELVRDTFERLEGGFKNHLREALASLDFGFYYFEKVYTLRAGRVVLQKLAPRIPTAHYKWETSDPNIPGVMQMLPMTASPGKTTTPSIPFTKLVLYTNEKEGDNFEGRSILRTAYKHWFLKNMLYKLDGIKHERGAGILVIGLPEGSSDEDKTDAENMGKNFKVNEQAYIIKPSKEWEVEMLTAGIESQSGPLMESVRHHDRMILQNILAQFLDLGSGKTGSFSLSKDQSSFFTLALRAIAEQIEEVVNDQIIKQLIDFNWGKQEMYPVFRFQQVGDVDYTEMSEVLERLMNAGLVKKDPELMSWVTKTFGLPERTPEDFEDEEDDDEEPPKPPQTPPEGDGEAEDDQDAEMAEGNYFRKLTNAEERVELADIDSYLSDEENTLQNILDEVAQDQKDSILKDIEAILTAGTIAAVSGLTLKNNAKATAAINESAKRAVEKGKATAAKEVGISIPPSNNAAKQATALRVELLMAKRKSEIENALKNSLITIIQSGVGTKPALLELEGVVDKLLKQSNTAIKGSVIVDAFDAGRDGVFERARADIHGLQRSEVLDTKTCNMCLTLDGRVFSANDQFTKLGAVHDNCRGIWVAILKTDEKLPPVKTLPKTLKNKFQTVEGVPTRNNFDQMKKPIIRKGSRLEQKVKDGKLEVDQ